MEGKLYSKNRNTHRPFHLYSGSVYFLTGRCYEGKAYFKQVCAKQIFEKVLKQACERFEIKLFAWILLDNHYHLLFQLPTSTDFATRQSVTPHLSKRNDEMSEANFVSKNASSKYNLVEFVRKIHKDSSRLLNKQNNTKSKKTWYQYWDYCIRNQPDFWQHFNYRVQQPLKHGIVNTLKACYIYPYSSNPTWLQRFGIDGLSESFTKYSSQRLDTTVIKYICILKNKNN